LDRAEQREPLPRARRATARRDGVERLVLVAHEEPHGIALGKPRGDPGRLGRVAQPLCEERGLGGECGRIHGLYDRAPREGAGPPSRTPASAKLSASSHTRARAPSRAVTRSWCPAAQARSARPAAFNARSAESCPSMPAIVAGGGGDAASTSRAPSARARAI